MRIWLIGHFSSLGHFSSWDFQIIEKIGLIFWKNVLKKCLVKIWLLGHFSSWDFIKIGTCKATLSLARQNTKKCTTTRSFWGLLPCRKCSWHERRSERKGCRARNNLQASLFCFVLFFLDLKSAKWSLEIKRSRKHSQHSTSHKEVKIKRSQKALCSHNSLETEYNALGAL